MLANYIQVQKKTQRAKIDSLTGISTPGYLTLSYDLDNYHSLLAHISSAQDPRWILFIAPPGKPNFTFLQASGINKNRILTLAQSNLIDETQLLTSALASNSYATVVTWVSQCSQSLQNKIQRLALNSKTHCFVYCAQ